MQLTLPETIQVLRRRNGLNQAELGAKAFGLNPNTARTKIKNIELGLQLPSAAELEKLADALGVAADDFFAQAPSIGDKSSSQARDCSFTPETVQLFPGITEYVDMLNNALRLGDQDLIGYLAGKLSTLFADNYKNNASGLT